jgi:toxin CcdB
MAQFDIYASPGQRSGEPVQYLLDLQAEVIEELPTRVVAPLVSPESLGPAMRILNPTVFVQGEPYILLTHLLAAVPVHCLGRQIASAMMQRDEIVRSIDFLFTGA